MGALTSAYLLFIVGASPAAGPWALEGWRLAPTPGIEAQLEPRPQRGVVAGVRFRKTGEERRLLALEAVPRGRPAGVQSCSVRGRLQLFRGQPPQMALVVYQKGGGVWFQIGGHPLVAGELTSDGLPLQALRQGPSSQGGVGGVQWDRVEKIWLGLLLEGRAEGVWELQSAYLSQEPYRPSRPLLVPSDDASAWSVAQDPAVQSTLHIAREAPGGEPCVCFEFVLPAGRHMYALPSRQVPGSDLAGYRGLRFSYRATLPDGIEELLVILSEQDGSQYYAEPAPPASAGWRTVTLPFAAFTLGGWSRDENDQLDLSEVRALVIGLHGTTSAENGRGLICATHIEFVP